MPTIPQPAMVWNGKNVAPYSMTNSWAVGDDADARHLCGFSQLVFKGLAETSSRKTFHLIINCHGIYATRAGSTTILPGFGLAIGKGIERLSDAEHFRLLSGYVDTIIMVACGAGATSVPGGLSAATPGYIGTETLAYTSGDGMLLMSRIAKAAQATVYAPADLQTCWTKLDNKTSLPFGVIDRPEGLLRKWNSQGTLVETVHMPPFRPEIIP